MPSVLLVVAASVLALRVVQAGACPLGRADFVLTAADNPLPDIAKPNRKLIGAHLRAGRFTSDMRTIINPGTGQERDIGFDAVELYGKAGLFVLRRDFSLGTNNETADSWRVGAVHGSPFPQWDSLKPAPSVTVGSSYSSVYSGDLAGLSVEVAGCRSE